jgi:hypothetical protein
MNPLTIKLDISDYNILVLNDFMRLFIIQLVSQVLFKLNNNSVELFSKIFIETTLFILLGVLVYWLIFNYIVVFTNKDKKSIDNYYQSNYITI